MTLVLALVAAVVAFVAGVALAPRVSPWWARVVQRAAPRVQRGRRRVEGLLRRLRSRELVIAELEPAPASNERGPDANAIAPHAVEAVAFDPIALREVRGTEYPLHGQPWRERMRAVGDRLRAAKVDAVVFVHGTFSGHDPLSAFRLLESRVPRGTALAGILRQKTRATLVKVLGDVGTFGQPYVRLFETAIGDGIPCTEFVWSSENHHLGRLEGALSLVRTLAMHARVSGRAAPRLLVIGHSHAGQLFALATQLLARSMAKEAFVDAARARGLDTASLEAEIDELARAKLDLVTLGAPSRYAWAKVPSVRALHVIAASPRGSRLAGGDWIARLGTGASDFPALDPADRRANASLEPSLGPSTSARHLASTVFEPPKAPGEGPLVLVDYGDTTVGERLASGFGHSAYTRLDGMLFHADLISTRLYGGGTSSAVATAASFRRDRAHP